MFPLCIGVLSHKILGMIIQSLNIFFAYKLKAIANLIKKFVIIVIFTNTLSITISIKIF